MAYDIPRNLTKYAEEFLFGLSLKQFMYTASTLLISFLIYISLVELMDFWIIMLIITPILLLGMFFVFFALDEKIKAQLNLRSSLYEASYFDKSVRSFIDVSQIKDDVVILKNGTLLGIIEIKAIDFFILGPEERERVLAAYRRWLLSIDYYVQILSRSVTVDLEKWLKNLQKKSSPNHKEKLSSFSQWMQKEIEKNSTRDRRFYIIIPQRREVKKKSFYQEMKNIFSGDYSTELGDAEFSRLKKSLRNNIINCKETLEKCDLNGRRLETDELLGLYSSYFTNQKKINKKILSPIIETKKEMLEEHEKIFRELIKHERIKQIRHSGD
jgi:hypothetical protein